MRTGIVPFIIRYVFRKALSEIDDLELIEIAVVDMIADKKI